MTEPKSTWDELVRQLLEASDAEVTAEQVTPETNLREDLDLGSLQAVSLVMDLEDEFGMVVEDEELEGLETVGNIHKLIERKITEGGEDSAS